MMAGLPVGLCQRELVCRWEDASPNFDDSVAFVQAGFCRAPYAIKCLEKLGSATVPQPYPDELATGRLGGNVEKVVILCNKDVVVFQYVIPNITITRLGEPDFRDVDGFDAARCQESSEGRGKLVVNETLHADRSTAWSV